MYQKNRLIGWLVFRKRLPRAADQDVAKRNDAELAIWKRAKDIRDIKNILAMDMSNDFIAAEKALYFWRLGRKQARYKRTYRRKK